MDTIFYDSMSNVSLFQIRYGYSLMRVTSDFLHLAASANGQFINSSFQIQSPQYGI